MDVTNSVFKTNDLFSSILHYTMSNAKDAPPIALTSHHWNDVLNHNPERSWKIWKQICAVQEPWYVLLRFTLADIRSMEAEFDEAVDYDEEQMIGNGYHSLEDDADEFDEYNEIDYDEDNDEMDF